MSIFLFLKSWKIIIKYSNSSFRKMYKWPDFTIQNISYFIKAKNREKITTFSDKIESDSIIPFKFTWDRSFTVFKQKPWKLIIHIN